MPKLGEKGTILQRDNQTYAVAPHVPCGVLTPQLLPKLASLLLAPSWSQRVTCIPKRCRFQIIIHK